MKTLKEMRDKIKDNLDLWEETWIEDAELNSFIRDAVEVAESEVHSLYEDYFLDEKIVPITTANNIIDYPADIYANKIRKIVYDDGNSTASHEVKRIKNILAGRESDLYNSDTTNPILRWLPINSSTTGRNIRLYPSTSRNGQLSIYYIRNAKVLINDADVCDIDEFDRFIIQSAKTRVFLKDGDPRADDSKVLEEQFKNQMILTLSNMAPDGDNEIPMDMSHYEDSIGGE